MTSFSKEQRGVVEEAGLLSVTACAGSGKTETSIHRLAETRRRMGESRGRPALLSFSNVAVDTFRKGYVALLGPGSKAKVGTRVEIETMDGFFTMSFSDGVIPAGGSGSFFFSFDILGDINFKIDQIPIPEPSALGLLAVGALAFIRRR